MIFVIVYENSNLDYNISCFFCNKIIRYYKGDVYLFNNIFKKRKIEQERKRFKDNSIIIWINESYIQ